MPFAQKKTLVVVAICVVAVSAVPARTESVSGPAKYMGQALGEMMAAVRYATDKTGLGYDDGGICVSGVHLREGESTSLHRPFQAGVQYVLLAGGDEDARDVDLEILDSSGRCVARDTRTDRMALVDFDPKKSGQYTIRLRLYASTRDAFCSFAVMQRAGYDVPVQNLMAAGMGFLEMCDRIAVLAADAGGRAAFPSGTNRGAVWGRVIGEDQSTTVYNVTLGYHESVVFAAGDTQAGDIDLYLETNDHRPLASDTKPDARAAVWHQPSSGELYRITVKNVTHGGEPSLVLFGVMEVTP